MNDWPLKNPSFHCACRFSRAEDFGLSELIEPCGFHSKMQAERDDYRDIAIRTGAWALNRPLIVDDARVEHMRSALIRARAYVVYAPASPEGDKDAVIEAIDAALADAAPVVEAPKRHFPPIRKWVMERGDTMVLRFARPLTAEEVGTAPGVLASITRADDAPEEHRP